MLSTMSRRIFSLLPRRVAAAEPAPAQRAAASASASSSASASAAASASSAAASAAAAAALIPELKPVQRIVDDAPVIVPENVDEDLADKSDYVKARVMERRRQLAEKQAALVREADERESAARREQESRDAARGALGAPLRAWAEEASGSRKNIRVLLSTLDSVLWADAKWEPVPMARLIEPKRVRLAFMKACTIVHPDKHNSMTPEHKFVAGEIFSYLETAFRNFQDAEMS